MIGDQVPITTAAESIAEANELSAHIDAKLRVLSPLSPPGNIFKVPELLRNVNAKAYEPRTLAIGPYHRSKNHLTAMEEHKLRYLKHLLELKGENNTNNYVCVMWELKGEARACYADSVDLKDDEFVEMMLLDACFIVELLRKRTGTVPTQIGDPILKRTWIFCNVIRDILLVENQLPFFVLQKFFEMTQMSNDKSLCNMIFQLFNNFELLKREPPPKDIESYYIHSARHILGLLHMSWTHDPSEMGSKDQNEENNCGLVCSKLDSSIKVSSEVIPKWFHFPSRIEGGNVTEENNWRFKSSWFHWPSKRDSRIKASEDNSRTFKIHNWIVTAFVCVKNLIISGYLTEEHDGRKGIPCATQLKEAGIKFKKDKCNNLFAVKFENGTMKIPTLLIDDNSESFFRNFIAYEQFFFKELTMNYVSDYIKLMDFLVNTSRDVELLCQCGIIENALGDDEVVANMFNRLCDNVIFSGSKEEKYNKIFQEVNRHCSRRWNKWKANLRHSYFNTPWASISFFAALLLLLLTVAQTVFSALGDTKQK